MALFKTLHFRTTQLFSAIGIISSIGLIGCQSTPSQVNALPTVTPASNQNIEVTGDKVIEWANGYDWQLTQAMDAQGKTTTISAADPITFEVTPHTVSLKQGCQNYSVGFNSLTAPPFPYHGFGLLPSKTDCINHFPNQDDVSGGSMLATLLLKDSFLNFNLKQLHQDQSPTAKPFASQRLALITKQGNTLIFQGTPKSFAKPAGLPITHELLEAYQWRLVSALSPSYDDHGKLLSKAPIGDFYHPDFPITLGFSNTKEQYASFYSNCNYGIGGIYALLKDHTLLIGKGSQTVMSCGLNGNRVETRLSNLETGSRSKLTLTLQPTTSTATPDFPRYNLLQTMATGETLVWQNEPLPKYSGLPLEESNVSETDSTKADK